MKWMIWAVVPLLAAAAAAREGDELIGKPAPALAPLAWVQGRAVDTELLGKVVLLRWWTSGCSLCQNTAPALNRLHSEFGRSGLLVIGVYHPKPPGHRDAAFIRETAHRLGFRFPIAVDENWTVLRRWWLDSGDRAYTSVSFLLDRSGRVRYVHPGGEFFPSPRPGEAQPNRDYLEIRAQIRRLLAEPAPSAAGHRPRRMSHAPLPRGSSGRDRRSRAGRRPSAGEPEGLRTRSG